MSNIRFIIREGRAIDVLMSYKVIYMSKRVGRSKTWIIKDNHLAGHVLSLLRYQKCPGQLAGISNIDEDG